MIFCQARDPVDFFPMNFALVSSVFLSFVAQLTDERAHTLPFYY